MTKKQKISLSVFSIMFLLPELLWSPVINTFYYFLNFSSAHKELFRNNLLFNYDNEIILKLVITIQLIAIISILLIISNKNFKSQYKLLLAILTFVLLMMTGFTFYLWVLFNVGW